MTDDVPSKRLFHGRGHPVTDDVPRQRMTACGRGHSMAEGISWQRYTHSDEWQIQKRQDMWVTSSHTGSFL